MREASDMQRVAKEAGAGTPKEQAVAGRLQAAAEGGDKARG